MGSRRPSPNGGALRPVFPHAVRMVLSVRFVTHSCLVLLCLGCWQSHRTGSDSGVADASGSLDATSAADGRVDAGVFDAADDTGAADAGVPSDAMGGVDGRVDAGVFDAGFDAAGVDGGVPVVDLLLSGTMRPGRLANLGRDVLAAGTFTGRLRTPSGPLEALGRDEFVVRLDGALLDWSAVVQGPVEHGYPVPYWVANSFEPVIVGDELRVRFDTEGWAEWNGDAVAAGLTELLVSGDGTLEPRLAVVDRTAQVYWSETSPWASARGVALVMASAGEATLAGRIWRAPYEARPPVFLAAGLTPSAGVDWTQWFSRTEVSSRVVGVGAGFVMTVQDVDTGSHGLVHFDEEGTMRRYPLGFRYLTRFLVRGDTVYVFGGSDQCELLRFDAGSGVRWSRRLTLSESCQVEWRDGALSVHGRGALPVTDDGPLFGEAIGTMHQRIDPATGETRWIRGAATGEVFSDERGWWLAANLGSAHGVDDLAIDERTFTPADAGDVLLSRFDWTGRHVRSVWIDGEGVQATRIYALGSPDPQAVSHAGVAHLHVHSHLAAGVTRSLDLVRVGATVQRLLQLPATSGTVSCGSAHRDSPPACPIVRTPAGEVFAWIGFANGTVLFEDESFRSPPMPDLPYGLVWRVH